MGTTAKEAARRIIEDMPDQASWDEIMYELYVKQKIEAGLDDVHTGRTVDHQEIKAEFADNAD